MAHLGNSSIHEFQEWKLGKGGDFIELEIQKGGEINVSKIGEKKKRSWEEFVIGFEDNKPCYSFFHFKYETKTGGQRSKTTMIQWIPSKCKPQEKMAYAMWSKLVKDSLPGIHTVIQACSKEDLEYQNVLEKVSRYENDQINS